jgi:hypothetical protein
VPARYYCWSHPSQLPNHGASWPASTKNQHVLLQQHTITSSATDPAFAGRTTPFKGITSITTQQFNFIAETTARLSNLWRCSKSTLTQQHQSTAMVAMIHYHRIWHCHLNTAKSNLAAQQVHLNMTVQGHVQQGYSVRCFGQRTTYCTRIVRCTLQCTLFVRCCSVNM